MTAVRRFLFTITLSLAATALVAQSSDATKPPARPKPKRNHSAPASASTTTTTTTTTETSTQAIDAAVAADTARDTDPSVGVAAKVPPTQPVTAETDNDLKDPRAMHLSLEDAVKTTMARNLSIQLSRYDYREAAWTLRSTYGIFDLFTSGTFEEQSKQSPTISQFQSSGSKSTIFDAALQQELPTGGTYQVNFTNIRATTNGGGTLVSPAYNPELVASATQPLLRNFGIDIARRNINIARNNLGINAELFRAILINTSLSVEQAYLDLAYARENVDVVKEAVFLARDQARITQIRIDVGASAPLDILQPKVQIATTEEQLITAVAAVRDAEDRLRQLLHLDPADWDRPIIPTDPVDYTPVTIDTASSVTRAYELRPEVREGRLTSEIKRINYLYAKNQTLPQLDLILSYGASGLAGRAADIDPVTGIPTGTFTTTGYTESLRQIGANDFPSWTIGFNVGIPVFNIGAKSQAKVAELDYRRSRTDIENTRETIAIDVRKTVRDIDTAAKEITATRIARDAAEKNLDAERKRYENGMTTNFNVLQIQQQLEDARVSEIQALVNYNKAVANYHRALGDLLDVYSVKVEEPEHVPEPTIFSSWNRYSWLNYGNRAQIDKDLEAPDTVVPATPETPQK